MKHQAVVGLGFGDESKGAVVDRLCRQPAQPVTAVVRFNGGHQAAHHVVLADGRWHGFSQFGSGTFRGVPTILSKFMVVEPVGFMRERNHLLRIGVENTRAPHQPLVTVDENCLVTTAWHMALNRAAEERREDRHGTCGLGFGETIAYDMEYPGWAPRVKDIYDNGILEGKLHTLDELCQANGVRVDNSIPATATAFRRWLTQVRVRTSEAIKEEIDAGHCIFEGAQGVLLDEWKGFHPHTTWSTTTYDNIDDLVDDPNEVERLGVLRCYTTRHGQGPLPTEDQRLTKDLPEEHNEDAGHQGAFRVGHFDNCLHAYAVDVCRRVDSVVMTHMDRLRQSPQVCIGYEVDDEPWWPPRTEGQDLDTMSISTEKLKRAKPMYVKMSQKEFISFVEPQLDVPVSMTSWGPTAEDQRVVNQVSA